MFSPEKTELNHKVTRWRSKCMCVGMQTHANILHDNFGEKTNLVYILLKTIIYIHASEIRLETTIEKPNGSPQNLNIKK